ncbi:MAG: glycosyltransferase [Clostridiales Family XIII bacterium]|nr:glycosyltransferase [Clostridiales Family XIII bacterium]
MRAKDPKINVSVIVPVYNAARYIGECLKSLTSQDADGLEIICVDDGSDDDSMTEVESVRRGDARVSAYYNEHAGPGAARNTGIARATGDYILFVDSDDTLAEGAVKTLFDHAQKLGVDVLYFEGESVYETVGLEEAHATYKDVYRRKTGSTETMTGPELLALMQDANDYKPSAVLQMYSREFIENRSLRFEEGVIHEDTAFSFSAILRADRAAVLAEPFYIRRVREGSIMTTSHSFDNVYGYYAAMKSMLRTMDDESIASRLSESEYRAAFAIVRKMCRRAAKMYASAGAEEIEFGAAGMSPSDRALMDLTVRTAWRNNILKDKKATLEQKLSIRKEKIAELKEQNKGYKKDLERVRKSFSYRLGRALTAIPRKIRSAVKPRKN